MPVKTWVSTAGVRDQRRARRRPRATSASRHAVPTPMIVIATPLEVWYECPLAVAIPAQRAATRTRTASTISMTAAASTVRGNDAAGGGVAGELADRWVGCACPPGDGRGDSWLAWARARALDREPTRHLHNQRPPRCHRPGAEVRRRP